MQKSLEEYVAPHNKLIKAKDATYESWQKRLSANKSALEKQEKKKQASEKYADISAWLGILGFGSGVLGMFFISWIFIVIAGGSIWLFSNLYEYFNGQIKKGDEKIDEINKTTSELQSEYDKASNELEQIEIEIEETKEREERERRELEANIKKYGHKNAIKVSQLFEQLLGYEKAIININALFVRYDQDNEIHTEQNNPITAIRDKAESVNREFYSLMTTTESEYKAFCDFGTHDIAHAKGEIEPDEYFVISKRLEAKMIRAIEVRAENNELSENIKKLDKQNL